MMEPRERELALRAAWQRLAPHIGDDLIMRLNDLAERYEQDEPPARQEVSDATSDLNDYAESETKYGGGKPT